MSWWVRVGYTLIVLAGITSFVFLLWFMGTAIRDDRPERGMEQCLSG